ncbi:MAG: hypothetical protein GKR94_14090 [Gammaproteobacteria bacterium]|nr:hypothetical protein [Gammaproteobacteria bacterium]
MQLSKIIIHLVLSALLALGTNGVVSAKVASADQNLLWMGHQADGVVNWLTQQGKSARSTTGPPDSPVASKRGLNFGKNNRKLDFLFNKNINQANAKNTQRARGNVDRISIADTPQNRAEVTRRFNDAFNDSSSIVPGGSNVPGRNLREFFLPGVTGTGSKIQFVEEAGKVITIMAK